MSSIALSAAKAPYVIFEMRPIEDRAATIANGIYTTTDVPFAIVTPAGSKDRYEYEVEPWLANLKQQVREDRFPSEWYEHFVKGFKAWKDNEALPEVGIALKNWPVLSPSQRKNLLELGVTTVEALAAGNEELIGRLGMGGRALVQRAQDFLTSREHGAAALQTEDLRTRLTALEQKNADLTERNANLSQLVETMRTPERQATGSSDRKRSADVGEIIK